MKRKINFNRIKKLYINGSLFILGSKNLYAKWNNFVFILYKNLNRINKNRI